MKKLNNAGQMTLDFIFAFVLVMGLTGILFSLSLSLTVSSITQYITYASARNYFAAHKITGDQYLAAVSKFTELQANPAFSALYSGGWFDLDPFVPVGSSGGAEPFLQIHQREGFEEYSRPGEFVVNRFMGVGADLTAKMLDFNIPFFGSTNPDSQEKGDGFKVFLASYIPLEPSQNRCRDFIKNKWIAIQRLHPSYSSAINRSSGEPFLPIFDNGC